MKKVSWQLMPVIFAAALVVSPGCRAPEQSGVSPAAPYYSPAGGGNAGDIFEETLYLLDILAGAGEDKLEETAQRADALGYEAAILLAARRAAEGKDAAAMYRRALSLYDTPALRGRLAAYLRGQGHSEEARQEYLALLPADAALSALEEMGVPPFTIAEALVKGGYWQTASSYLQTKLETDAEEPCPLAGLYARALVALGEHKKALTWFERVKRQGDLGEGLSWWHARTLEAVGRKKEAMQIYEALGETGAYRLALLLEREGHKQKAAAAFAASPQALPRWRGARLYENLGRQEAALLLYLALAGEAGLFQDDAAYRAYILLGGKDEQAAEMLRVLEKQPAWLVRLGKEPAFALSPDPPVETPEFLWRADAFSAVGRADLAAVEIAIGTATASTAGLLALADWYRESGEYGQSVRWGARGLQAEPSVRAYTLAYPRPFADETQAAAAEFGLDPYLIWAVMREESRFQAEAVSRAGAMGLMQIMPATGRDIASRLKVTMAEGDLFEPGLNIRFGAFYLKSRMEMFGNDQDRALAAYNAGSGNVQKWIATPLGATLAGFPTAISFLETREYITRVRNSYQTYRWLYSQ